MSALIVVCASDAVHILTDGAATYLDTGIVAAIHSKQIPLRNGAVVTGAGSYGAIAGFAELAANLGRDEVREAAPELWKRVCDTLPARQDLCILAVAGWSDTEGRPWVEPFRGDGDGRLGFETFVVFPTTGTPDCTTRFLDRFLGDPDAFEPADGVALIEELRCIPRQYQHGEYPAVGGFVQHTKITGDGATTRVVRDWPDLIGQRISIEERPWPSPSKLTEAQFFRVRRMCVLQDWDRMAGRPMSPPDDHASGSILSWIMQRYAVG
jgi:hypothetical protein